MHASKLHKISRVVIEGLLLSSKLASSELLQLMGQLTRPVWRHPLQAILILSSPILASSTTSLTCSAAWRLHARSRQVLADFLAGIGRAEVDAEVNNQLDWQQARLPRGAAGSWSTCKLVKVSRAVQNFARHVCTSFLSTLQTQLASSAEAATRIGIHLWACHRLACTCLPCAQLTGALARYAT